MSHSILILDDDVDFNSLLTDIFEQADYDVTSMTDPVEAAEKFRDTHFDLVVSDFKMPEMSGVEFMSMVKKVRQSVPVIMVSGYLENDTIRELISQGVGGVFLKPLNIFSLLERTAELIEEGARVEAIGTGQAEEVGEAGDDCAELGFTFRSYPCKSEVSRGFAERLYNSRDFKSTLSLIGEKGMHYRSICEDIQGFYENEAEHFVYLNPDSFDEMQALSLIDAVKARGAERVTCVLLDFQAMDESQKSIATNLAKREAGFSQISLPIRTIFCVSGDLDELFDEGLIGESLYFLMGTAEVRVPPLRECSSDIGIMVEQMVLEIVRGKSLPAVPRFERSARDLFQQNPWEGNFEQLRATVRDIISSHPGDLISQAAVRDALKVEKVVSPRALFESHLSSQQVDYLKAVSTLLGGDRNRTAAFFGTDVTTIEPKIQ